LGQLGTPQYAKQVNNELPLIPVLANGSKEKMGMVFGSLGFKTWRFLDRVRRFSDLFGIDL